MTQEGNTTLPDVQVQGRPRATILVRRHRVVWRANRRSWFRRQSSRDGPRLPGKTVLMSRGKLLLIGKCFDEIHTPEQEIRDQAEQGT
jgi:hypothetical protein